MRGRTLRRALALAGTALIISTTAVYAAVSTDRWLYDFGDTVQISGDEMQPGEDVVVDVFFPDGALAQEHLVTADEYGAFVDSFYLADGMPGGIYSVVATGLSSGHSFTTEFDPLTMNVAGDGSAWTGETKTYTANTGGSCSAGDFTFAWSVGGTSTGTATVSPSGTSADFTFTGAGTVVVTVVATRVVAGCSTASLTRTQSVTVSNPNTVLTLDFDPASPIYGEHTGISGALTDTAATPVGQAGKDIVVTENDAADCSGTVVDTVGTFTTSGGGGTPPKGDWPSLVDDGFISYDYQPMAAGNQYFKAYFAGSGAANAPATACETLTTDKAPTETSVVGTPSTSISLGATFNVGYEVLSYYGILDNITAGDVSITQVSGPAGSSVCGDSDTLNESQLDAAGSPDLGFDVTGTLTCQPDMLGTYTYHVSYAGDDNYYGSNSSPDLTIEVVAPYTFLGFWQPIGGNSNSGTPDFYVNAKAGQGIALKWNLFSGADEITNVSLYTFKSTKVACSLDGTGDATPDADDAGQSGVHYDFVAGQTIFVWNTNKNWAKTCRDFELSYKGQVVAHLIVHFTK